MTSNRASTDLRGDAWGATGVRSSPGEPIALCPTLEQPPALSVARVVLSALGGNFPLRSPQSSSIARTQATCDHPWITTTGLRVILFDFDGTLADSFPMVVAILDRLSPRFGYPKLTPAVVAQFRDLSSRDVLKQSRVPLWQQPWLLYRIKRELSANLEQLQPIAGMAETLQALRAEGYCLGIVTSNSQSVVEAFLRLVDWEHYFTWVDAGYRLFSKDRAIVRLQQRLGLLPGAVAYVGDETRDVEAARRSGATSVSVAWGFNSERALRKSQPDVLVHHPYELLSWARSRRSQV
ncbi:MAG: HAD family hydrolase [Oscillatoriales cyanobacterium]|nr:MAG: HAD family hydrolase [Oscillatoriales cyanobacterium]